MALNRRKYRERGSILVETAVALPVLLLLLGATFGLGRVYGQYQTITHAAREGARFSATPDADTGYLPSKDQVLAVVNGQLSAGGVDTSKTQVTIVQNDTGSSNASGYCSGDSTLSATCSVVKVSVPASYPGLNLFKSTLTAEARMRNETN
jgi:Flp pilus assembly protein TadG